MCIGVYYLCICSAASSFFAVTRGSSTNCVRPTACLKAKRDYFLPVWLMMCHAKRTILFFSTQFICHLGALYCAPFPLLYYYYCVVVTPIRGHLVGSFLFSSLPTTVRALHFHREKKKQFSTFFPRGFALKSIPTHAYIYKLGALDSVIQDFKNSIHAGTPNSNPRYQPDLLWL